MAKMRKKKIRMMIVFRSIEIADVSDRMITCKFLDFETVLRGLKTLSDLILCSVSFEPSPVGSQLVITIMKSKMFQLDFK